MTDPNYVMLVDGVAVPMTDGEIAARKAEETAWLADQAKRAARDAIAGALDATPAAILEMINLLIKKGVVAPSDLTPATQAAVAAANAAAATLAAQPVQPAQGV